MCGVFFLIITRIFGLRYFVGEGYFPFRFCAGYTLQGKFNLLVGGQGQLAEFSSHLKNSKKSGLYIKC